MAPKIDYAYKQQLVTDFYQQVGFWVLRGLYAYKLLAITGKEQEKSFFPHILIV